MAEALRIQEEGQTEPVFLTATCGSCDWSGYLEGPADFEQGRDRLIGEHHDKRAGCTDIPMFEGFGEEERETVLASFSRVEMHVNPESGPDI
ncbi:MAG: hypothetical protein A2785_04195 [Candidatus Chisholmbacteria bacterium RIFCSPHIGHO2_01_FULL_49_18]|uniref:Uncharacterized protein n=2 Tax=Candidatus Chisholmiibacteriota TaxID=1817900 RepID=A0A1G1VP64_9BACT|nr:MAG: hypothetical protein A2785_04195 [Candidatus Chisholmbacteria bacterium RIFCSPHIGHO2_01_FULL_49_18]OGY22525.1 MAG: hypothetical protein A3A65_00860 [Candidatus Chisholmbacteria bacterium RIFCSPLOWO2_01_FULL_49_14]